MIKQIFLMALCLSGAPSLIASSTSSRAEMARIKAYFLEKKSAEAVAELKQTGAAVLKSASAQQQVVSWLSTFQYDSSLGLFEKTLDLMANEGDESEIDKNFQEILKTEPYNPRVLSHLLGHWLSQNKITRAREKNRWAQVEMPYVEIYNVFAAWMDLKEGTSSVQKFSCHSQTLSVEERDFCVYVKVLDKLQDPKTKKESGELTELLKKTTIPNKLLAHWEKWKNPLDKQKYLSSCATLSGKQKKAYLFVPNFCFNDEKDETNEKSARD